MHTNQHEKIKTLKPNMKSFISKCSISSHNLVEVHNSEDLEL